MVKSLLAALAFSWSAALLLPAQETARPASGLPPAPSPAPGQPGSKVPDAGAAPALKHLGGPRYELNGISFNETTRAITFPAKVNMVEGLLEYAVVHESGKAHESFLTTAISPYDLNVVLLLLNYKASTTFFDQSDPKAGAVVAKNPKMDPAANLVVTLEWKDASGTSHTARLESLLLNLDTKSPASHGPFTYTGSMVMEDGTFMARQTGSILALYADAAALINNPRADNENDDVWITDRSKTPAKASSVTLTLSPSTGK